MFKIGYEALVEVLQELGKHSCGTYEFPSNEEGREVPAEETPFGVFEDILIVFEQELFARVGIWSFVNSGEVIE